MQLRNWTNDMLFKNIKGMIEWSQTTKKTLLTSSEGGLSASLNDFLNSPLNAPPFSWNTELFTVIYFVLYIYIPSSRYRTYESIRKLIINNYNQKDR